MKLDPDISVIMSVYNAEETVNYAIESILEQSFKNFEFIIINDGSTDKSETIIRNYVDKRIKFISQSNVGLTKSLNKAIKISNGKYIARQDADEVSHYKRLEIQYNFLINN